MAGAGRLRGQADRPGSVARGPGAGRRAAQADSPFEAVAGDARRLEEPDEGADAVLLLGPLYHLQEREERLGALGEAHRVLRVSGEPDAHREAPDAELLAAAVRCAEAVEREPTLIGMSAHLLATGSRR